MTAFEVKLAHQRGVKPTQKLPGAGNMNRKISLVGFSEKAELKERTGESD